MRCSSTAAARRFLQFPCSSQLSRYIGGIRRDFFFQRAMCGFNLVLELEDFGVSRPHGGPELSKLRVLIVELLSQSLDER